MRAPVVLAFDTSAAHCAAAVVSDTGVLAIRHEDMATGQAERLMPFLEETLAAQSLTWRDLSGIGVGTGPGNFTGVRISVAAARGLALALKVPAIGITTLEAMAFGAPRPVTVELDARRGQVYRQHFTASGAEPPQLCTPETPRPAGDLIDDRAPDRQPLVVAIGHLALARLSTPQPRPAPLYLRPADAALPATPPPVILP